MDKLTQGEQKIEQAKIDKRIAALYPGRDTTPERRQIDALTKQHEAEMSRRLATIEKTKRISAENKSELERASKLEDKLRKVNRLHMASVLPSRSSTGEMGLLRQGCEREMREIQRLNEEKVRRETMLTMLMDQVQDLQGRLAGTRAQVGGKKSKTKSKRKKSRRTKSKSKKSRSKTSRRTKAKRTKSRRKK